MEGGEVRVDACVARTMVIRALSDQFLEVRPYVLVLVSGFGSVFVSNFGFRVKAMPGLLSPKATCTPWSFARSAPTFSRCTHHTTNPTCTIEIWQFNIQGYLAHKKATAP